MYLKTIENIRKVELLSWLILNILYKNNITDINNIEVYYNALNMIRTLDVVTFAYTEKITKEYKELKEMYLEIVKNTSDTLKELDIQRPVDLFVFYIYLYRNGYLSYNHSFNYSMNMKDFAALNGLDVIRGKGVCRSISSLFTDLCVEYGLEASNLLVHTKKDACSNLQNLSQRDLAVEENGSASNLFMKLVEVMPLPNHMITLVGDSENSYIFDPTNDGYLQYAGINKFVIPDSNSLNMKNSVIIKTIQKTLGLSSSLSIMKIHKILKRPNISNDEYIMQYREALELCEKNELLFAKIYQLNKDLYNDINDICKEQSDFLRRFIPLIPGEKVLKRVK